MSKINFFGSIPAIVTPFKKNGDLDLPALERLVDLQLKGGVDAIVVAGSTGEAATLSDEEYVTAIKTVVKKVSNKVPVIAGAGSNDTKKAIHLSSLAKEAGANALLIVTPYYNKPTPNGLVLHYKAIAKTVDLPIILYNVPGRTGSNVAPQVILRIAREVPNVIAVKEASGSLNQMLELMNVNFIETNPIPVKTALAMMGLISENFRLPLTTLEDKNRAVLEKTLKTMGLWPL